MRIALISDLHANEVALKTVLDDIARVGADRITVVKVDGAWWIEML